MALEFGKFLKGLRLNSGYGLRRFAGLIEMPASNLSAIEHGRRSMPDEKLPTIADALGLVKGTPEWDRFFDLGAKDGQLPVDVQGIANKGFVPALLRTIDNKQLSDKEIMELIKDIQQANDSA